MKWQKKDDKKTVKEVFMRNMGVENISEVNQWFKKSYENDFKIKKLKEAVELAKGFRNKRVTIIGDYDADGVTATSILLMGLKEYGFQNVSYCIPKRFTEGFGINDTIIDKIEDGLIITCDNGIAGIDPIKKAKAKGLTVIITDHHEPVVEDGKVILPEADIIINPNAIEHSADFNGYCGAGLAYKFICELFNNRKDIRERYLPYATIGTIADVMDLQQENYVFVRNGLKLLKQAAFCTTGLNALINELISTEVITASDVAFKVGPTLNALSRLDDTGSSKGVELLTFNGSLTEAKQKAEQAVEKNTERKLLEAEAFKKAEKTILRERLDGNCPIVVYIPDIHEGIVGIVAGNIAEKYKKPTLVFTDYFDAENNRYYKGSARTFGNYNLKKEFDRCPELFTKYGGHEGAAGMTILPENLAALSDTLNSNAFESSFEEVEESFYDIEIEVKDIPEAIEELKKYEPWGKGNPEPVFLIRNFIPIEKNGTLQQRIGENGVKIQGYKCTALNFKNGANSLSIKKDSKLSIYGKLSVNEFKGYRTNQIIFSDIKVS